MKFHLFAGSCLAGVSAASISNAVDITLGGSIDMGIEFGVSKNSGALTFAEAYNGFTLSFDLSGTTDMGMKYGGSFSLGTTASIEFNPYVSGDKKYLGKASVEGANDIVGMAYNVSGGAAIASSHIVAVKINSSWRSVGDVRTDYVIELSPSFVSSNICKVAGRAVAVGSSSIVAGDYGPSTAPQYANAVASGYLPVGQVVQNTTTSVPAAVGGVAGLNAGQASVAATVGFETTKGAVVAITKPIAAIAASAFSNPGSANITRFAYQDKGSVDFDGSGSDGPTVTSARIYAGPFMEVKMASSTTKLVVGAACVEGLNTSDAAFYLDNVSKVMTATDASIFVEGGFGRLTLQSGDYSGGVTSIAGAGDQADIKADGLVVIGESVGLLGANPYVAVDLAPSSSLGELELVTGASVNMGNLIAAFDLKVGSDDLIALDTWDLGMDYSMGGLAVGFAADSNNDWGLSASMAAGGFAVDAEFGATGNEDHTKSGIVYSIVGATSLNGFGISLGLDQDLKTSFAVSYGLGNLNLYAGYDVGDEGGAVGATLSF
ncbi:MAG: hypothetical protein ACPG40_00125 [Alphaproteobacteria bacterium]